MTNSPPEPRLALTKRKKALFAALVLLVGFGLAEGVARLCYHPPDLALADTLGRRFDVHPYLGFTAQPPVYRYGGAPDDPCDADAAKVACLGGSTTRDQYPHALRDELAKLGLPKPRVQVLDAGCPGFTTMESQIMLMIYVLPLRPDFVVVMHGHNDVQARLAPGFKPDYTHYRVNPWRQIDRVSLWRKQCNALLDCSRLVVLMRETATGYVSRRRVLENYVCAQRPSEWTPRRNFEASSVDPFKEHLRNIYFACKGAGVRLVLVTQPLHPRYREVCHAQAKDLPRWARARHDEAALDVEFACHIEGQRECNDAVRALCREYGIALVDWAKAAAGPGAAELFEDHVHLNQEGDRVLAGEVARALAGLMGQGQKGR